MCGFIAQLVEHCTGIAEVMSSNSVEALIFFRLPLSNCFNWKIYYDDHSSLCLVAVVVFLSLMVLRTAVIPIVVVIREFTKPGRDAKDNVD